MSFLGELRGCLSAVLGRHDYHIQENICDGLILQDRDSFRNFTSEFVSLMMDTPYFCDNFNRRQFFALSLIFMFVALLALRLDDFIFWPYWVIFFPLWLWQSVVFGGFLFEIFTFCRNPRFYIETQSHFKSTFFDAFFHVNLLFFEVLSCNRLENAHHSWISVFIPLVILSIFGVLASFCAIKNDFSADVHFICSANFTFFVVLALQMEGFIDLSWKFVFLPNWMALAFFLSLELIEIIISICRFACVNIFPDYRQQSFCISFGYSTSLLMIITSGLLLALKLDNDLRLPVVIVTSPLMSALTVFMSLCFSARPHFHWLRCFQLVYHQIIEMCHPLQEYGNISYKLSALHQPVGFNRRSDNQQSAQSGIGDFQVRPATTLPPTDASLDPVEIAFESPKSSAKTVRLSMQETRILLLPPPQSPEGSLGSPNGVFPYSSRLDAPD